MSKITYIIAGLLSTTMALASGSLTINQSDGLDLLVYKNSEEKYSATASSKVVEVAGFRVQIYSSNLSKSAKTGAFELEKQFTEIFPETHAYVTYAAPFWKLRVGDFATYYEALSFSNKVKEAFPDRATEIFVVKEEKVKPIYLEEPAKAESTESVTDETILNPEL